MALVSISLTAVIRSPTRSGSPECCSGLWSTVSSPGPAASVSESSFDCCDTAPPLLATKRAILC